MKVKVTAIVTPENKEELRETATMTTEIKKTRDDGGVTVCAIHTVTLKSGNKLRFLDRNIFDFGRVISPDYAITPGRRKGGLRSGDNWQDLDMDEGWRDVRQLTSEEKEAYKHVQDFGYYAGSIIRM